MTKLLLLATVTIAILATAAAQQSNLRCLDGSTPLGTCTGGLCPVNHQCSLGNICCPTGGSNTQTCPNNENPISPCLGGLCPEGYTCNTNSNPPQCCRSTCLNPIGPCVEKMCPVGLQCNTANNQCCPSATGGNVCPGNTVLIGTQCIPKTNDGACLNVNCLSTGNAGCANYAPYKKCGYNAGQKNYFCCQ